MDKKTIYDVAREAGVSISTVSRVINGSANVRESTRRKVEAACVNYRPVASARDLPAKRSKMIGVLINHRPEYFFLNDTYSNALLGISVAAKEAGYRLLLDICDTETEFDNLFYEQRVDGFVMMGVRKNSTLISLLKQHEVPFVLVGSYHEDESVYQVDINDQSAIFSVTNYLIGLGHKRIGIITSSPEYTSASDRVEGYCQAMREAGLTVKTSGYSSAKTSRRPRRNSWPSTCCIFRTGSAPSSPSTTPLPWPSTRPPRTADCPYPGTCPWWDSTTPRWRPTCPRR